MISGILLIDKEKGVTSRKVDNTIGKRFGTHSVGHLGTLDPFATGLLIVALNKGTKLLPFLEDGDKTYEAILVLGTKTSTGDPEGEVVETKEVPHIDQRKLDDVLSAFIGKSTQIPPVYSAIKVNGVPMYKAARSGKEVELKPRDIEIYSLSGTIEGERIKFIAKVSKGTYIRTLGEDIAKKLGTVGHLENLRRTRIGNIKVDDAKRLEDIQEEDIVSGIEMINLPRIELDEKDEFKARNGQNIILKTAFDKALLIKNNVLIAVYKRKEDDIFIPERGLF